MVSGLTIDLFERSPPRQSLEVILLLCIAVYVIRSPNSRTPVADGTQHSGCSTTETHCDGAERNIEAVLIGCPARHGDARYERGRHRARPPLLQRRRVRPHQVAMGRRT